MPFYPHRLFMEEFEAAMMTTEFFSASPPLRNAFVTQWNAHRDFLQQQAEQATQAMESQMVRGAVAQATQQAAAQTAALTVESATEQITANTQAAQGPPNTEQLVRSLMEQEQAGAQPPQ